MVDTQPATEPTEVKWMIPLILTPLAVLGYALIAKENPGLAYRLVKDLFARRR